MFPFLNYIVKMSHLEGNPGEGWFMTLSHLSESVSFKAQPKKMCLEDNTAYYGNNIIMGRSNPQLSRDGHILLQYY